MRIMMSSIFRLFFTLVCLFEIEINAQEYECPQRTGFFPDPVQCDLYYKCSKGEAEQKLCPDGLVFDDRDPNHGKCDIPSNVKCGDRIELQEAQPSKGCPRANGYYRHDDPLACDKFYNCVDGTPFELPCPAGLVYDDVGSTCRWPADNSRLDCTKPKKDVLDDGFSCPDGEVAGPNGRTLPHPTFTHPDDCQKFYICRNGIQPQKGSCSADTVYNEATFTCEEPANVPGCEHYYDEDKKKN